MTDHWNADAVAHQDAGGPGTHLLPTLLHSALSSPHSTCRWRGTAAAAGPPGSTRDYSSAPPALRTYSGTLLTPASKWRVPELGFGVPSRWPLERNTLHVVTFSFFFWVNNINFICVWRLIWTFQVYNLIVKIDAHKIHIIVRGILQWALLCNYDRRIVSNFKIKFPTSSFAIMELWIQLAFSYAVTTRFHRAMAERCPLPTFQAFRPTEPHRSDLDVQCNPQPHGKCAGTSCSDDMWRENLHTVLPFYESDPQVSGGTDRTSNF